MKRGGIINARLAGEPARLGHTDLVVGCDAGLPIPPGPAFVDLAFRPGVPSFEAVLSGPREELVVRTGEATPYANVILRRGVAF